MYLLFLGLTFLLTAFLPVGQKLLLILFTSTGIGGGMSGATFNIVSILSNYVFSAIIIAILIKTLRLKERLPNPYPAKSIMAVGVLLSSLCLVAVFLIMFGNNLPIHKIKTYAFVGSWAANILLVIATVKILLATNPLTHHSSGTPNGAP